MGTEPERVLQILGKMNRGGAETMVMNLYRSIDRERIQFDFAVHSTEKCDYDDEIIALGGKIYRYPHYKGINHFSFIHFWKVFFKEQRSKFLCVHCHTMNTCTMILGATQKMNISTILHCHNAPVHVSYVSFIKSIFHRSLHHKGLNTIKFACSEQAGKYLYKEAEFTIFKNAIPTEKFLFDQRKRETLRKQLQIESKFVIGNISRFNEQKNHMFLLDIFHEVHKKNENALLLLVGDGSLRLQIEEKIKALQLEDAVILTGVVTNPEDYLQAMDVFLFPSLFEGLGMVLVEAQVSGSPCVTSAKVVPEEVKLTDLVEFVSLEESAETWATKILAYQDGYERSSRKEEIMKAGYDVEETVKMLEDIYLQFKR